MPIAQPKKIPEQDLYEAWDKDRSPKTLTPLIRALEPSIRSSMSLHGFRDDKNVEWAMKNHLIDQIQNRYDPKKGTNIKTFTYETMKRVPRVAASQKYGIHVPEGADFDMRRIRGTEQDLLDKLGRDPTTSELSDIVGLSSSRIDKVKERYGRAQIPESVSIQNSQGEEHEDLEEIQDPAMKLWVEYTVDSLTKRDRLIYEYLTRKKPLSKVEIAKKLGISPAAVTQRAAKIVGKLNEFDG